MATVPHVMAAATGANRMSMALSDDAAAASWSLRPIAAPARTLAAVSFLKFHRGG